MLSADLPTFCCHLRHGTTNNSIYLFILKVINVLLIVHDLQNLLLGKSFGLVGQ